MKAEILQRCDERTRAQLELANAILVKIVDIQNGKSTETKDGHGLRWRVYDPLARVGFYNPKEVDEAGRFTGTIQDLQRENLPGLYLPSSSTSRTLWVYLRSEGHPSDGWREVVKEAVRLWRKDKWGGGGVREQQGTSNSQQSSVRYRPSPRGGGTISRRGSRSGSAVRCQQSSSPSQQAPGSLPKHRPATPSQQARATLLPTSLQNRLPGVPEKGDASASRGV